jgi:acyl-coenzyme A thioesterase PaaI-like protein
MNEIPDNWHEVTPIDARRAALHHLAQRGRLLADRLIASEASEAEIAAATVFIDDALRVLPERGKGSLVGLNHFDTFADQSPVIGLSNMTAPPARLTIADDAVTGHAVLGVAYEGPPGHVHGGWIASLFDEVLGMVQATTKKPGMTGRIEVSYKRPTPLHVPIHFHGVVDRVEGRKIFTSARSFNPETNETYAEATAIFISIEFDRFTSPTRPDGLGHRNLLQGIHDRDTPAEAQKTEDSL